MKPHALPAIHVETRITQEEFTGMAAYNKANHYLPSEGLRHVIVLGLQAAGHLPTPEPVAAAPARAKRGGARA